ncbi:hypothetical protein [Xanthomonas sp. CFBP 8445]|uniref:hypothetical protein n=1 Tax=Xanthomonas sp. CFBP 8445 TaxID=2971236 RepID=UPI0021DF8F9E|nr:hypothetical protein [Xanthomonas sp. CFBP 8445]UYC11069.1 hypothetical protein NUG21_14985 [Xanthomonas sp. CFBP 8445]
MTAPGPTSSEPTWLMPTPHGVLHGFASATPDRMQRALQLLLGAHGALSLQEWRQRVGGDAQRLLQDARDQQWVQLLRRAVPGPEIRLDDFAQHVIAPLSAERRAVLASDSGFCLGHAGLDQEQAETLSVAAADFSGFAQRQSARGWHGAHRYVAFYSEPQLLLPDWSFVPFWVDGAGYWLVLGGEALLNNLAMVELVWSIRLAAARFAPPA